MKIGITEYGDAGIDIHGRCNSHHEKYYKRIHAGCV